MSVAPSEVWSRLVQIGLAGPAECQKYAAAFSKATGGVPPNDADADAIVAYLVRSGILNRYQGQRILDPHDPGLRLGSFIILSDQAVSPFSHWLPVQTAADLSDGETRRGFLLRVPLTSLDDTLRGWLAIHSEIQGQTLQPVQLSGGAQSQDDDHVVEIFSAMPEGGSLLKVLQGRQKLSRRKTVRMGVDLARALAALHAQPLSAGVLTHGSVGADHVWVTPKGHGVLLRDPSSPPRSPHADHRASWIDRVESPAQYAAPELADPAAVPTIASDVYSLGCLLFSLLMGRSAFQGKDDSELFAAHQNVIPPELAEAAAEGAAGDPLLRVLTYAMAKDPAARFASAEMFAEALARVGDLTDPTRTSSPPETSPATTVATSKQSTAAATVAEPPKRDASPNPDPPPAVAPKPAAPKTIAPAKVASPAVSPAAPPATAPEETAAVAPVASSAALPQAATLPPSEPDALPANQTAAGSENAARKRKRRRRNKNRIPILAGMMVVPTLLLGLAIILRGRGPEERPPRPRPRPEALRSVPKVASSRREVSGKPDLAVPGPGAVAGYELVDSDRLLWVTPYPADSAPPPLSLLPPGPAGILSVPIAGVISDPITQPLLSTFDSELSGFIAAASRRAGVPSENIGRCTAAFFPGRDGWPEVALAIELTEPMKLTALTESWNAGASPVEGGAYIYVGEDIDGDTYFVGGTELGKPQPNADVTRFAVGPIDRIREVAQTGGAPIPLVRPMQTLWDATSEQSDLIALFTPNFLFADGRQLVLQSVPEFRNDLKRWLIPDVAAVSVTIANNDSSLYFELREVPSGGATAATLLRSLRDSIDRWDDWGNDFNLRSVADPSWRLLAMRLPMMLQYVGKQTRSTILGESVVASTYLPGEAASQVALATLLAMNTPEGRQNAVVRSETTTELSVEDMLNRSMSISFLQQSLQFSVAEVVDEFKQSLPPGNTMPAVRIVGGDLELNGITQNQQIRGFERENVPLRSVLTDLVLGANPDKTATGPKDPKQALIWVVHPTGKSPDQTEILITTRDAAKAKQYELPPEFRLEQ